MDSTSAQDMGETIPLPDMALSSASQSSHTAKVAIQSAKIVNAYGTYIQVLGILVGLLVITMGFILTNKLGDAIYAITGIGVGLLDISIFAVQGAFFRMVANYVMARLE